MRYRKLTADGDYSFGQGLSNFYIDVPEAPAQAVKTRLLLETGEWFLDVTEGTPWQLVRGKNTASTRDLTIKNRTLKTPGVIELMSYASQLDQDRHFSVQEKINTIYGQTTVEVTQ